MSPLSVQVHVTCAVCWAPAQCCCQPTGVWPSKTLLHVKMWPPSLLQRSSRAALPPQGAQSKRLEWSCRWTRTCFYLSSSVCIINLFFFPSDGCVFFGDDSLLVRWFSSTSKPGISSFKLKLILCIFLALVPQRLLFAAGPPECRAGGLAVEHVRGHSGEEDWPADGAGDLRASPQGRNAAPHRAPHPAAGWRCLQKLSEWIAVWFWSTVSLSELITDVFTGWSRVHGWKWIPAYRPQSNDQGSIAQ